MNLLDWWNLLFVLPFLGAVLYLLLQAFGLTSDGSGGDGAADAGLDADGHPLGFVHAVGIHDHASEAGLAKALSFFGIGRVPISIIVMSFCLIWGFTGWASNLLLQDVLKTPLIYVWISLGVALFASVTLTGLFSRLYARFLPTTETYAVPREALIGRVADVIYAVNLQGGTARLRDQYGNLRDVPCRVDNSQTSITAGQKVILMRFDSALGAFIVKPDPLSQVVNGDGQADNLEKKEVVP